MRSFIQHRKFLLALMVLASFLASTLELHADHDLGTKSQATQHCCVQCCPSHNLPPLTTTTAAIKPVQASTQYAIMTLDLVLHAIPKATFRPPITLS